MKRKHKVRRKIIKGDIRILVNRYKHLMSTTVFPEFSTFYTDYHDIIDCFIYGNFQEVEWTVAYFGVPWLLYSKGIKYYMEIVR